MTAAPQNAASETNGREDGSLFPQDWQVVKLGKLMTTFKGGAPLTPRDFTASGVVVLPKLGVTRGGILRIPEPDKQYCSEAYAISHPNNTVDSEYTVVVLRDLVPDGPNIGLMVRINEDDRYLLAQGVYGFKVEESLAIPEFLIQLSNTAWYRRAVNSIMVGSTQVHITNLAFKSLAIPLPTKKEQQAIAAALSDVDALTGALEKLIAKKRAIKLATMQQLLSGKRRLKGFRETWGAVKLGTISEFITKGATPTTYGFGWATDGVRFLRSECVSDHGLDLSQSMMISSPAHALLKRSEVRSGDILITITGNVGRVVLLDDRFGFGNINQHIARIRIKEPTVLSDFVFQYMSQERIRICYQAITTGQAYPQISLVQVRNTEIPRPCLEEQIAIATVLSDMDRELTALEHRRSKTRAVKQGMMQALLTGRVRLVKPEAAA